MKRLSLIGLRDVSLAARDLTVVMTVAQWIAIDARLAGNELNSETRKILQEARRILANRLKEAESDRVRCGRE